MRRAAEQWKQAKSEAERNTLFNQHGVRWSEFWRLPYFNPLKHVVVDGMHTLFLGLVEYHIRQILGIDDDEVAEEPVDPKKLAEARVVYANTPTSNRLNNATVPVLKALCREQGIELPEQRGRRKIKKEELINIMMSFSVSAFIRKVTSGP